MNFPALLVYYPQKRIRVLSEGALERRDGGLAVTGDRAETDS